MVRPVKHRSLSRLAQLCWLVFAASAVVFIWANVTAFDASSIGLMYSLLVGSLLIGLGSLAAAMWFTGQAGRRQKR